MSQVQDHHDDEHGRHDHKVVIHIDPAQTQWKFGEQTARWIRCRVVPAADGSTYSRSPRLRGVIVRAVGGTVPAIALTGYAGVHENERAVSAGYQMYLAKPVEPGRLAEIITTLVGKDGKPYRDRASASPTRS